MKDFKKLKVWQKAHNLTLSIYTITKNFLKEELYGLTSQIRRASSSIPTNIAEGCGRGGDNDFARFLQISMGSASELEYHLLLSMDLGFIENNTFEKCNNDVSEIKQMLSSFIKSLIADC
jgi:four helix bundle protein